MRQRQRRTMTLEVSADQRETLESLLAALPSEPTDDPIRGTTRLAGLFYHPNSGCRVMALVLSAGFDVAKGRTENAGKKIERAIEVFTLVSDDADGRALLEGLKGSLAADASDFLTRVKGEAATYLKRRMNAAVAGPAAKKPAVTAMPRAVEDGEELPAERRSTPAPQPRHERSRGRDDAPPRQAPREEAPAPAVKAPAVKAPAEAPSAVAVAANDEADAKRGPTEEEAAAAAAAALAAMDTPYEEIVEDNEPPRFDPDRDVPVDEGRRRRRRRGPEGFERPRPDQRPKTDAPEKVVEPASAPDVAAAAPSADGPAETADPAVEAIRVARGADAGEIAEAGLEALRMALRRAREAGLSGRLTVEVSVGPATEEGPPRRRRRRRRRRRGGEE